MRLIQLNFTLGYGDNKAPVLDKCALMVFKSKRDLSDRWL